MTTKKSPQQPAKRKLAVTEKTAPAKKVKKTLASKVSEEDAKLEAKFVELCQSYPEGLPGDVLEKELKDEVPVEKRKIIINSLTSRGRLRIWQDQGGQIIYKLISAQDAAKFKGLGQMEMLVYQLIGREANMGLWVRDIRIRSGIPNPQLEKILKTLRTRKLIKLERSIAAKNKKVYMLYELEPAKEISGGAWYNAKGDFDTEFVDQLYLTCYKLVKGEGTKGVTVEYITDRLKESGAFMAELSVEDISSVLNAMCYDGVMELVPTEDDETILVPMRSGEMKQVRKKRYRAIPSGQMISEFTTIPCSRCPVASQCSEDGVISPTTCQYFTKWMSF